MPWQVNCRRMRPMAWSSVSGVGAVGCTACLSTLTLQELCWLSLFLPPSLYPNFASFFLLYLFFLLHSLPIHLPLLLCYFHGSLYPSSSSSLPSLYPPPPLPPCSMRHQVGTATLGCRAALTTSSATACLRVPGPGPSLQMSMKPYIIWTGCSRVSLWHTSMKALDVFARCDG